MTERFSYRTRDQLQLEDLLGRVPGVLPRAGPARGAIGAGVAAAAREAGFEAPHYQIDGPHRLRQRRRGPAAGACHPRRPSRWSSDAQRPFRTVGPARASAIRRPPGSTRASAIRGDLHRSRSGRTSCSCSGAAAGTNVYHYWPSAYNTHDLRRGLYFLPARRRASGRPRDGRGDLQGIRAAGRQHARGHAVDARVAGGRCFPLCDQEILCRHFHKAVARPGRRLPGERQEV